jgi:cytochrome c-type biogenesis protein
MKVYLERTTDMFIQVNHWTAFTAGILSFFTPCLLPLVPAYIMYLTGSYDSEDLSKKRRYALIQTLGFIIGFTIVFMILGVSASAIGQIFARNKDFLSKISGLAIILFGIYMTGLVKIPFLSKDYRKSKPRTKVTFFTAIAMGMAFAFGWTPCFGPILGAILASTAFLSQNVSDGVVLLFVYSMGMAVPFLLTAVFMDLFDRYVASFSKYSKKLNFVAGIIMIIFGILIFTDKMIVISNWLLEILG